MKKKTSLSILIFSWRGPQHPHAGGAEIVTHEHAKAWVKKGHQVTLFTSTFDQALAEENIDGVRIVRRGSQILSVQLQAFFWYLFGQSQTFDLVIDQFHGLPFFTPLFVRSKKMAFIHEVTKDVWRYNPLGEPFHSIVSWLGQIGEPAIFRFFYKKIPFMTVSASTKSELVEYGVPPAAIQVVHNGFHQVKTSKKNNRSVITFIGAIAKDKGIEDAIKVFALLKNLSFSFWVIGKHDDEYFRKIKKLVETYDLKKRVKFWGYVTQSKKFELLSRSFLVVNPSVREGWGLTVIESAAVKTPTVAYRVSGLKDAIVHGKTGILVNQKTPESLAQAIKKIYEDQSFYRKLQIQGYQWSKKFNWLKATKQSTSLIEKIVC
jgi:glycosyltransferase involved in cell wall biosynthesis